MLDLSSEAAIASILLRKDSRALWSRVNCGLRRGSYGDAGTNKYLVKCSRSFIQWRAR